MYAAESRHVTPAQEFGWGSPDQELLDAQFAEQNKWLAEREEKARQAKAELEAQEKERDAKNLKEDVQ